MKCLCCGKEILNKQEMLSKWHDKCIKKFFGLEILPSIEINKENLKELVIKYTNMGITVPGVQKKLSLFLLNDDNPRLTLKDYPIGYILKPQTEEYELLPEAEYLVMSMAREIHIKTVPFSLIELKSNGNELAYITKRIDRVNVSDKSLKLAMEDFCQLENRLTVDKYKGSYERCAAIIKKYSSSEGLDLSEFFFRIVFSFITGNSDMHLKNFSLIETGYNTGEYRLSEAYDLLPVNIILTEDKEELALTLNGKKRNLRRNDFIKFGETIGLSRKSIEKMIEKIISYKDKFINLCDESYLTDKMKKQFKELLNDRIERLSKNI